MDQLSGGAAGGVSSQGLGNEALFPAGGMTDSDTLASIAGAGGGGSSSGLAERLKLAGSALGTSPTNFDQQFGSKGPMSGGGVRMGTMPTMSSLDNLVRILQRQDALGATRRRREQRGNVFEL